VDLDGFKEAFRHADCRAARSSAWRSRAHVNEPRLLLLERACPSRCASARRHARRAQAPAEQDRHTTVYGTHDQSERWRVDRIAVIDRGRITQIGLGRRIFPIPSRQSVVARYRRRPPICCRAPCSQVPTAAVRSRCGAGARSNGWSCNSARPLRGAVSIRNGKASGSRAAPVSGGDNCTCPGRVARCDFWGDPAGRCRERRRQS